MGSSRWDAGTWSGYATTSSTRAASGTLFTSKSGMDKLLDPKGVLRESRDSVVNPNSTPIAVFLDVTGSMGYLSQEILTKGLGVLAQSILDRSPVTDPHILFGGVGDVRYDVAPLQVTQFEADIKVAEQLEKVYLEGGGGGNRTESYDLPWYFAAEHTACDAWEKRQKKGYLFTVGDEEAPYGVSSDHLVQVFGGQPGGRDYTAVELLEMAEKKWEVFHIIIEQGSHARRHLDKVRSTWSELLGQRVISLSDHNALAETIVSAIEVNEGRDKVKVAASWADKSAAVGKAIANITPRPDAGSGGLIRL